MTYRGYEIKRVPHNIPHFPASTTLAVINPQGQAVRVVSEEVGQHVIDIHVDRGDWPEVAEGGALGGRVCVSDQRSE